MTSYGHRPVSLGLTVALLAAVVITSCARPKETPTPQPTPAATAGLLSVTPTAEPQPTPTVTMDLPPVVVDTAPAPGQEQPPEAAIVVRFDQAMDPASTQAAFSIAPTTPGEVSVEGRQLIFRPSRPLARATTYEVAVSEQARSQDGKSLAAPLSLRFHTVGFLQVTSTQPADGNADVAVDTPITVVFNRPVVPLTGVSQMADLPQPLTFDPPVRGTGQWLNTSIYTFRPDEPLAGATEYRVTVAAGLQDTTGGILAEDYVFAFTTASPIVTAFEPTGNRVAPTTPITVTFSQPMDPASTEAAFSLREAETAQPQAGAFTWLQGRRVMRFEPATALRQGVAFVAEITADARSAGGNGALREAFKTTFQTAPKIAIVGTTPADGAGDVPPETAFRVLFQGVVDEKTLGKQAFRILPEPTQVFSYFASYDNTWTISWPVQPQTDYRVTLSGKIGDVFGNTLGADQVVAFRTSDRKPFAHLNVPNDIGTYNAYTNTLIAASYRNVSSLDFKLYTVSEADGTRLLGPDRWNALAQYRPKEANLIRQWSVPVTPEPNQNILAKIPLAADGGSLTPGMYWVEMRAPEVKYGQGDTESGQLPARHLLIVSPLNLVAKKSVGEILVWATDLRSGQPAPGLPVRVTGPATAQGVTDGDGIFRAPVSQREPWQPLVIYAGSQGEQFGAVSTDWQDGIGPWEYGLPGEFPAPTWQGFVYTDRPIYRPGQTVHWKGILRADNDALYQVPPPGTAVQVTINNSRGEKVFDETMQTNAFGTLHGDLPLADEAGLGFYYLEIRLLDVPKDASYQPIFGTGFQVAEYRKPEYVVELSTDKEEYLNGDAINTTLQATYFFGAPVSGAGVEWTAFSQDASFAYDYGDTGPWYSFEDFTGWPAWGAEPSRFGGVVGNGRGTTDAQGRLVFSLRADISDRLQSQVFTIDSRVTDLNNQEVAASRAVVVHKGLVYVGVAPRSYVTPAGRPAAVDLITVDWDSQPVPGQIVTVVVNKAKWINVQEKGPDGRFYWTSQVQETPILTKKVTTNAQGKAELVWTPEAGGQYKINASVVDSKGNEVRSAAFLWVGDAPDTFVSWRVENNDRIELAADKKLYQVGDTARVLVPHPYQGDVEALVTIERGTILDTQRITLRGNGETLEIPIKPEYVPNVFLSVVIVKGQDTPGDDLGSFKLGYVELPVDTVAKQLKITLTPSQTELKPGEVVTFTLQATDHEGKPVQGEFSLALVDKALLSLVQGGQITLLDTFYRERGLGVQTASTLVLNLDRLNQQLREGAKGGGGGDGEAGMVDVRSEFEDTALWEPAIVTDVNGRAVVSVRLPDNLTTWQLDGRGVTVETKVGQATVEVKTTLPLLVRPVLPRFFTVGDRAEIGAVVLNNTDTERQVDISLAATGLITSTPATQSVVIAAGQQVKVVWPVEVTPPATGAATGPATIRFTAIETDPAGDEAALSDAVELALPVHRYSSPETVATAGTVAQDETRLEVIVVPPNVDPTQGELRVRLDPSLAAGMVDGLTYLEHFPYECTEQIVSRFLPNTVSYGALKELGVSRPELEANLEEQIATGTQKLLRRQNPDGGWGWWSGERSQPFVSAYTVFGLVEAQKAGFTVDEAVVARGLDYLQRQLEPASKLKGYALNQQAFILYVLAQAGQGDMSRSVALYEVRERLQNYGKALLALTFGLLAEQGETAAQPRITALLDDLTGAAIVSATGAHWQEESTDWWTMNTDTRSTSLALDALALLDPQNGLAPNVVRWLMVARQDGRWETTQENVWAIIALTDWMKATGELQGDYSYAVSLNRNELASGAVTPDAVGRPINLRVAVQDLLLDAANGLEISRFAQGSQTGEGQLYYTTYLQYYLPAASLEPLDRGLVVAREYALVDPITGKALPGDALADAKIGDTIQVTLTLVAPSDLHYLAVESPLPAGAEAIDTSLATTSGVYEDSELQRQPEQGERPWWPWWTPTSTELRDEKVVMFATYLPAGTYQFSYQMRASLPGQFQTLPATAYEMYFPEVWGRSGGELFNIAPQ